MWTVNLQIFKLVLEKAEEPEIKLPTYAGSWKRQKSSRKTFLLYWLCQSLWLCGSRETVENSERDGNTRSPDLPLEKLVCRQEATVRTGHGTTDWFQIGKGGHQGCILSPCLFNLCRVHHEKYWAGWSKLESGEISNNLTYAGDNHPYGRKRRGTKVPLDESERGGWKVGLKLNFQKTKIMASGPITSREIGREAMKTVTDYFLGLQNHCRCWVQPWN